MRIARLQTQSCDSAEVDCVFRDDRTSFAMSRTQKLVVAQAAEISSLSHRDHIVPAGSQLLGNSVREHFIDQEPHRFSNACSRSQASSATLASSSTISIQSSISSR